MYQDAVDVATTDVEHPESGLTVEPNAPSAAYSAGSSSENVWSVAWPVKPPSAAGLHRWLVRRLLPWLRLSIGLRCVHA